MTSTDTIEPTSHSNEPPPHGDTVTAVAEPGHEHHHHAPTLNPECTREVEIEVPAEEVSKAFRSVTKRYQSAARIPGFRSGKAPESLIRGRFAEKIRQDVIEALLPEQFRRAIAEQNLKPVSQPQVLNLDLEEGKPLRFKAVFEVVPEFSLEGYGEVRVEKPDVTLTDAEFDQEIEHIRDSRSTMEPVTEPRPLADGDFAQISYSGLVAPERNGSVAAGDESKQDNPSQEASVPGTEEKPITGEDVLIEVGGKNTLETFNGALRGAEAGQELKFEVPYPEDFGEKRLAGKTVAYDVTVKGIKRKVQPELNDDFAKELGHYESYADFARELRDHMQQEKRRRLEHAARTRLVDALAERYQFPVPESLVQQQIDLRLDRGLRALASQGMRTEEMRKLDFDRLRDGQREAATAEVKGSILLDRIADVEAVQVPESEVEAELEAVSSQTQEPLEVLRKRLTENGGIARIREQLRREKVGALLYDRMAS